MKPTLLFDLDGTLVDSRMDIAQAINHAIELYGGIKAPIESVLPYIGTTLEATFQGLMHEPSPETIEACTDEYKSYYFDHCDVYSKPFAGVKQTLTQLRGHRMAVVTTKRSYMAQQLLQKMDLAEHFELILGTDPDILPKPDPALILRACDLLECEPRRSVLIGDTEYDIRAAHAAGCKVIAALYGFGDPQQLEQLDPDAVAQSFDQISGLIRRLFSDQP
ncbi:MAG: HAD-IA family hydrolase [Candidatus Alcyoniella australis]|nr:HAD-IA family hydrolase [Candidatus Alcyoniella australis]